MDNAADTKIGIRRAHYHDLPALENLLRMGFQEESVAQFYADVDMAHVYKSTIDLIELGLVFVAVEALDGKRERVVGTILFEAKPWHWNPRSLHLRSLFIYVAQAYRSRSVDDGVTIADAFIEVGKNISSMSRAVLLIDTATPSRVDAKNGLFQKHGLVTVGGIHVYLPPAGEETAGEQTAAEAA